jgi:pimeloyl-ACP methyl ester carboxylesterase
VRRLPLPLAPRRPRDPVLRRRDWTFPPPRVERAVMRALPDDPVPGRPPLLFVHGAWHGAWCWERWLSRAAAHGWAAHAVDLRGHGGSSGADHLARAPLRYLEHDVLQTITELPSPPVLIGHSLGALVVQHVLERYPSAPAGVLLAPIPPAHGLEVAISLARHHPRDLGRALVGCPPQAESLFGPGADAVTVSRTRARLTRESWVASYQAILPRRPRTTRAPVLVVGGGADALSPPRAVLRTARHHGTRARRFRGLGHDLMLEPGGDAVLDLVLAWLEDTLPGRRG